MSRQKGTPNTPQTMIDEIVARHSQGKTLRELSAEYEKPFKTLEGMITRENNKKRRLEAELTPKY